MDGSIKTLTITGAAATRGSDDNAKPRRASGGSRRKRLPVQDDTDEDGYTVPVVKAIATVGAPTVGTPTVGSTIIQKLETPQVPKHFVRPAKPLATVPAVPVVANTVVGPQSVILKPRIQPRINLRPKQQAIPTQPTQQGSLQTRKARRIHLTTSSLTTRLTRAKKVRDETEKKSIDTIRSYLVGRGVIQAKSKAPEKMLRSMYGDFTLLKDGNAL